MRDYLTTMFNLVVGLVDSNKIVTLALVGLGVVLICQLISLLANGHLKIARRSRKLYEFLNKNELTADNYNQFLSLISKMPQEFIRGYKVFEYSKYGLPSNFIKRFESVDVESSGGIFNHGKSLIKYIIYSWTIILALLSIALLGSDAALTGYALADALLVPVLFFIFAKVLYFIFNAIKQQQYHVAVDEFNELLDVMDDKIVNKDNMPGPDILADIQPILTTPKDDLIKKEEVVAQPMVEEPEERYVEHNVTPAIIKEEDALLNEEVSLPLEDSKEVAPAVEFIKEDFTSHSEVVTEEELIERIDEEENIPQITSFADFEEEKLEVAESAEISREEEIEPEVVENVEPLVEEIKEQPETFEEEKEIGEVAEEPANKQEYTEKEEQMEEKRGRGRPRKVAEGELVITNDKQFEEVLLKAEKLMRKSEEALSASQAKRVEKALKELIEAMAKYKEGQ